MDLREFGFLVAHLRAERREPGVEFFVKDDKSHDDGLDAKIRVVGLSGESRRVVIPLSAFHDTSRGIDRSRMYVLFGVNIVGGTAQTVAVDRVYYAPSDLEPPASDLEYRRVSRPPEGDPDLLAGAGGCLNRWLTLGTSSSGPTEGVLAADPSQPGAVAFCSASGAAFTSTFFQVGPESASRESRFQDWSRWPALNFEVKGNAGGEPLLVSMQDTGRSGSRVRVSPITTEWRAYSIPLRSFGGIDLGKLNVPAEFIFDSAATRHCVSLRNIRFGEAAITPSPTVTRVVPASGPAQGGNVVEVLGSDFAPTPAVRFGSAPATAVTFVDPTRLRATPPSGRGVVAVTVTNPDIRSFTLSNAYTYLSPPPALTQVTPASGQEGTSLTLLGREFLQGASVHVGGIRAGGVTWVTSGQLFAVAPQGSGTVSVTVTNPDNQSSVLANAFTYSPPSVSSPSITATVQSCRVGGVVTGATPPNAFRLLVWSRTDKFYIQPCVTEAVQSIRSDGSFGLIDLHNGEVYLQLVSATYTPPATTFSLPPTDNVNVFLTVGPVGSASTCDVPRCRAQ
ncbi:MAG: IPT/TIG domain-containing protein [Bryobacteraceae bacterium]